METTYKNLEITAEYTGSKKAPWGPQAGRDNYNHHEIIVTNIDADKEISFDFWGSIMNPQIGSEKELLEALQCFVSDAMSGSQSFEEFCSEFGYDEDSRSAYRTWEACVKAYDDFTELTDEDIYDFYNELQEVVEG